MGSLEIDKMKRPGLIICLLTIQLMLPGCSWLDVLLPEGFGPGYVIDGDEFGTGRQAIFPRNDHKYWNGEPMDLRSK